jgi:hypothetical protein
MAPRLETDRSARRRQLSVSISEPQTRLARHGALRPRGWVLSRRLVREAETPDDRGLADIASWLRREMIGRAWKESL